VNAQTRTYLAALIAFGVLLAGFGWILSRTLAPSLPDFGDLEAGPERKQAFLTYLRPIIESENDRIREDRNRLKSLDLDNLDWMDESWLAKLAMRYDVEATDHSRLMRRVDIVPASLALAQAAKESGWGSSRFAREGFNLYGQRCYVRGCGLPARSASPNARWELAAFLSPATSVRSYLQNINTHDRYRNLRAQRANAREADRKLSGMTLAGGLEAYSERGSEYVEDIRNLISHNDLE
jgi:Bax protein